MNKENFVTDLGNVTLGDHLLRQTLQDLSRYTQT